MPLCLLWGETHSRSNAAYDELQHKQNRFLARHAQAWTFPSRRLADLVAKGAGLDPDRCFVIPHMVSVIDSATNRSSQEGGWIIYAGTFYQSVFSEAVKAGIARYARSGRKQLMFVLKQPPAEVRGWISENVPGACVYCDLSPGEVANLTRKAQGVLIVDNAKHSALLFTKVVEAVHSNKPILAFAAPGSTTADVVSAAGGIVVNPVTANEVEQGFHKLERLIEDEEAQRAFASGRQRVVSRFSAERIAADSMAVLEYARKRFEWCHHSNGTEPEPPAIERWP
jgi:hypothetical protein